MWPGSFRGALRSMVALVGMARSRLWPRRRSPRVSRGRRRLHWKRHARCQRAYRDGERQSPGGNRFSAEKCCLEPIRVLSCRRLLWRVRPDHRTGPLRIRPLHGREPGLRSAHRNRCRGVSESRSIPRSWFRRATSPEHRCPAPAPFRGRPSPVIGINPRHLHLVVGSGGSADSLTLIIVPDPPASGWCCRCRRAQRAAAASAKVRPGPRSRGVDSVIGRSEGSGILRVRFRPYLTRFTGCLLGLAVGDAVGTTLEFRPRGSFEPSRT
jgi:hypothetical protein